MDRDWRTTNGERRRTRLPFVVRRSVFVVLSSSLFVLSSSAQEPSFKSGSSELVVLPVVVTDRHGKYVSDLPGDGFTIFDNGRRVPVELFTNQDTPVTVGLIVDASGSMRPKIGKCSPRRSPLRGRATRRTSCSSSGSTTTSRM